MINSLLDSFWNCGDNQIIEFAILRAHLNSREKEIVECILDELKTQEQTAEELDLSVRTVQKYWKSASTKLINIPWVRAYGEFLERTMSI